ncbi:uncharacterized protein LOC135500674 [Lineus longissimus]|uniref:uncharacterized protein LOC135500674 n=1 Tax=Lineus longissimus TaxID=88925 RepID=UPI00315CE7F2
MEPEKSQLKCGFAVISKDIECGTDASYPNDKSVIPLKQCKKDVHSHLMRWMSSRKASQVQSEWELIALRAGVFDMSSPVLDTTICPNHRYKLSLLSWNQQRRCQHPLHQPSKTSRKPRKDGGSVHRVMSREIYIKWGVFVPVGSALCKGCEAKHRVSVVNVEPEVEPAPMATESAVASSSVQPADALENPADGTEGQI